MTDQPLEVEIYQPYPNADPSKWGIRLATCAACGRPGPEQIAVAQGHDNAVKVARSLGTLINDPGDEPF